MRRNYVVGRLLTFVPTLLRASIIIFVLLRLVPNPHLSARRLGPITFHWPRVAVDPPPASPR